MKKYVFWSVLNLHTNVALTEDLSKYAQGDTFWQAMLNLGGLHRNKSKNVKNQHRRGITMTNKRKYPAFFLFQKKGLNLTIRVFVHVFDVELI